MESCFGTLKTELEMKPYESPQIARKEVPEFIRYYNTRQNLFQCFDPQCQAAGNVLDFWAALHKLTLVEAVRQLRDRFAPHVPPPP
jgi:hypothetical protein